MNCVGIKMPEVILNGKKFGIAMHNIKTQQSYCNKLPEAGKWFSFLTADSFLPDD